MAEPRRKREDWRWQPTPGLLPITLTVVNWTRTNCEVCNAEIRRRPHRQHQRFCTKACRVKRHNKAAA